MRMNPPPYHLRCVWTVADAGSFTAAAGRLGISQPALSRIVQDVEMELGCRIFERTTRNLRLTPIGEQMLQTIKTALADYEHSLRALKDKASGRAGVIRIAALPSLANALLSPVVAELRIQAPDIQIEIFDDLSDAVTSRVIQGDADIGLVNRPARQDGLVFEALIRDRLGLICRGDDPLSAESELDWTVFKDRPFLAMAAGSSVRALVYAAFAQAQITIQPLYEPRFVGTVCALVLSSAGISALPEMAVPNVPGNGLVWRPLRDPLITRSSGILRRADRPLHPAAAILIASLKQKFGMSG